MRKALLLIGSPKPGESASGALGEYMVEKLQQRGLNTETLKIRKLLESEEGVQLLLAAVEQCDELILSAPLYVDTPPAIVFKAMEIIAAARNSGGQAKKQRMFVISNCGFPEAGQNGTALAVYRCFAKTAGFTWAGEVAIGAGAMISVELLTKMKGMAKGILRALDVAAEVIATRPTESDTLVALQAKPSIASWLYLMIGSTAWRVRGKKNGVGKRLNDRPYQV